MNAAQQLIYSQLKSVIYIANSYSGYNLSREDLIQEGNIGLMKAVKNYDPERNCLPFTTWLNLGFRPKKGSKALKSVTFVERRDNEGNVISKFPRTVCLFYYRDCEKITPTNVD